MYQRLSICICAEAYLLVHVKTNPDHVHQSQVCMTLSCAEHDVALCKAVVSVPSQISHNWLHTADCKINEMKTKCVMFMLFQDE